MKKLSLVLLTALFCAQLQADPMSDLTNQINNRIAAEVADMTVNLTEQLQVTVSNHLQEVFTEQMDATAKETMEPAHLAQLTQQPVKPL